MVSNLSLPSSARSSSDCGPYLSALTNVSNRASDHDHSQATTDILRVLFSHRLRKGPNTNSSVKART